MPDKAIDARIVIVDDVADNDIVIFAKELVEDPEIEQPVGLVSIIHKRMLLLVVGYVFFNLGTESIVSHC